MSEVVEFKTAEGKPLGLPHNIDVEQALLGAIFINNDAFYRVADYLGPDHFHEPVHRQIYEVVAKLVRGGRTATPVTVKTYLPERLDGSTSMPQYLARLAAQAVTVLNAADYGQQIFDLAQRRALIGLSQTMAHDAFYSEADETPAGQIAEAERALYAIAERGAGQGGFRGFNESLAAAITMAGEAYHRDGQLSGQATGLVDLDRLMGGLQKSDLIIVAARPGMGKTALATGIAFHVASQFEAETAPDGAVTARSGGRVGFFSLEMSAEQLATRILAEQAGIASSDIRRGDIHESQFSRLVDTSNAISSVPLHIDDTGGLGIAQLVSRARRLKRQKGLDLLIIDYLQLLSGSADKARDNRVQELTEITTKLKALAKELDIPVLALSQLSRQVENREDKHPLLSDLRESGSIEQDADVVLFVYREEYYLKMREPKEGTPEYVTWEADMAAAHNRAEVIIGKQRHGPTGMVQLSFEPEFTKFGNLAHARHIEPGVAL